MGQLDDVTVLNEVNAKLKKLLLGPVEESELFDRATYVKDKRKVTFKTLVECKVLRTFEQSGLTWYAVEDRESLLALASSKEDLSNFIWPEDTKEPDTGATTDPGFSDDLSIIESKLLDQVNSIGDSMLGHLQELKDLVKEAISELRTKGNG